MRFLLILILLCLFALAFWKQKPGRQASLPSVIPMPGRHKTAVSFFMFAFFAGTALVTLRSGQAWPIVRYRIYDVARVQVRKTYLRLVGTKTDGSDFPFSDNKYMAPLDPSLLAGSVQTTLGSKNAQAKLDAMVADIYSRYEKHRQEHRQDGPPLVGLRMVREVYIRVDPVASNLGHPDENQIVAEYKDTNGVALQGTLQ